MHWYSFLVATVAVSMLVAAPAMAQTAGNTFTSPGALGSPGSFSAPGTFGTPGTNTFGTPGTLSTTSPLSSPSPTGVSPRVTPSMTGGIPGTLGAQPFNAGGSTTGAIGNPSTFGTSTTGPSGVLGGNPLGSSTGTAR